MADDMKRTSENVVKVAAQIGAREDEAKARSRVSDAKRLKMAGDADSFRREEEEMGFPPEILEALPRGGMSLKVMAIMLAQGHSEREVAAVMGIPADQVKLVMEAPSVQEFLEKMREHYIRTAPLQKFSRYLDKAVGTIVEVMEFGEKSADRLKAAGMILDRALGTAVQRVEVKEESTVSKLLDHMQKIDVINGVSYVSLTPDSVTPVFADLDSIEDISTFEDEESVRAVLEKSGTPDL